MNIGVGIPGGEVVAEVGEDMIVTSPEEGKEIIVVEAGASVEALIITRNVEEANMMMKGVVEVGLMEVRPLLVVALVLGGAPLHAGPHHLGVAVQTDAMAKQALLLQRVSHHAVVDVLVLVAHLLVLMLMNEGAVYHVMHLLPVVCLPYRTQLWPVAIPERTFQSSVNVTTSLLIARIVCS